MLRLRKLEQRVARLEDLAAVQASPITTGTPAEEVAEAEVPSLDRALQQDVRRSEKAEIAAQKLARAGVWVETTRFMATADNPNVGLIGDFESRGPVALLHVVEGGKSPSVSPSHLFSQLPADMARRLVVRDVHRSWFHRGLPGVGTTPPEVADGIREALAEQDDVPVVIIGSGFAGFGAILLGALMDAAMILVIDAPTTADPEMLRALGDDRWHEDLAVLEARKTPSGEHLDLLSILRQNPVPVEAHYSKTDRLQRRHAERLRGLETVVLRPHDVEGSLVSHLIQGPTLAKLLRRAVGSQTGEGVAREPSDPSAEPIHPSSRA
jgi:hypothetical protein